MSRNGKVFAILLILGTSVGMAQSIRLRMPEWNFYEVVDQPAHPAAATGNKIGDETWIRVRQLSDDSTISFGSRILVQPGDAPGLTDWMSARGFSRTGVFPGGFAVYGAPSPEEALAAAAELAEWDTLNEVHPVRQARGYRHFPHAGPSMDPYLNRQWHLENPFSSSFCPGVPVDLNFTAAWPITRGNSLLVACVDDGVEATHPDLAGNYLTAQNYNAFTGSTDASHGTATMAHGTAVAGILGAVAGNGVGGSGAAPGVKLASWVIFNRFDDLPAEDRLADVFNRRTDVVPIQNHSWGNADFQPLTPSRVEFAGISNAVTSGRNGRGVVMVRSAGNVRTTDFSRLPGVGDANLDGYASHPGVIAVAALGDAGRVSSYSTPGACILVAGIGGATDGSSRSIFTTDRVGANGWRTSGGGESFELADYLEGTTGFSGTSASAPQVSAVVAMMLSANPLLTVRDVQQLLIISSRHFDLADPGVVTNGAGLRVSHNVGFGAPDAGLAVRWAAEWPHRPARQEFRFISTNAANIADDGLRVETTLPDFPGFLQTYPATSGVGLQPDPSAKAVPLANLGDFNAPISTNVNGAGVIIRRDPTGKVSFADKIQWAANAGARFAVIFNHSGTSVRYTRGAPDFYRFLGGTDFSPIPAVFVDQENGEALVRLLRDGARVSTRLTTRTSRYFFEVPQTLQTEHVGLRIRWQHPQAADLRVTLTSPSGVVSLLHRPGMNTRAVPSEVTYWTTQHFFESSAGVWTVAVGDEWPGATGSIQSVELIMRGVPISDTDRDGLPDDWEEEQFGGLGFRASGDFDEDGVSELKEYLAGTSPKTSDAPLVLSVNMNLKSGVRVSWPARDGVQYEVLSAPGAEGPYSLDQRFSGRWPELSTLLEARTGARFFRVRRL